MKQLHKKFTDLQIKDLITRYLKKNVERKDIQKVNLSMIILFIIVMNIRFSLTEVGLTAKVIPVL